MGVGRGGLGPPWILKISANRGCFLGFDWEKTNFATFGHLIEKFWKNPLMAPPGKNSSDAHACQRSFSKLKLIKNYFRSSMRTLRLRCLATLFVEQQLTDNIHLDIAIDEFANKKARKVTV